ncbi:hypothetical protein [Mycobacterium sherrisii]|uniref:Ig-like domain-containing protein n=1 Tax=Mycobacterium sherrisii TaxID=243061 RepID=A0A1E3ST19_9MYCO|nr:hypothetical protein [Mycobacterium sherrisii]MCV7030457.1 hypothetical protein [Mycobacterium sherrisii]MEC4762259.1 hypothetical protein [Mycobacterium sherrisii]ODR04743.1 hypothetical protein BHQ21_16270 [Mycobacterium sherrisii]ORW81379.1 hypothetical protein AWC25_03055 [Mycobacterium sherrisii]
MSRRWPLGCAVALTVAAGWLGAAIAYGDTPGPGDSCTILHATAQDANGRTLWCNPTMTGDHSLVWQYGGPAD